MTLYIFYFNRRYHRTICITVLDLTLPFSFVFFSLSLRVADEKRFAEIGIEMASINESSTTQKKKTKKRRRKTDQIQLHTKSAAQTKRSDRLKDVIRRQHLEKNVDVFGMYDVGCNPLYAGNVTNETLEIDNNETETFIIY